MQLSLHLKRTFTLVIMALLLAWSPVWADEAEDFYLESFQLIQQADALQAGGKPTQALAKYQEAQAALRRIQSFDLKWHAPMVTYRLTYVADKIAAISGPAPTPAAEAAAPATQQASVATKAPSAALPVKLLAAGAEPRKVLRLHPSSGDRQTMLMTLKMAMDMKVGDVQSQGMKLPPMNMTMDVTVKNVAANGDITYDLVMNDAAVADDPGAMPQVVEAMKASCANLKGMAGTGTVSTRGLSKGIQMKTPATADPQTRQTIEQMKDSFSRIAIPLPEEAVGSGAKWEVKLPIKSQGMTFDQVTTYELVSMDGEKLTAKLNLIQSAANQKIQNPAMPGLKVDLTKMSGTGAGDITADLAQLLPSLATIDSHSDMTMGMNMGGQNQAMGMKMDMNLRLEAK
ncbi:MAG TPA: DUF6263 family protein [Candidatus Sulfotelmatobacter sp.]|nr:DUF6263 family protein [Candidatus Sulfotelmatobacter sp.]HWI56701.1 DUF6263 family protein [Bacillota bacterium]